MRTLIVGVGALGGIIAARLIASGARVWLAVRDSAAAAELKVSGLHATGIGGTVAVEPTDIASLADYFGREPFDLIVLATKARDAIEVAPELSRILTSDGSLLPIQNGGVSQMLADQLGADRVLGGLSNLGATMTKLGRYEQRNSGHLLIGEIAGGKSERGERIGDWLGRAVEIRLTANLRGAVWSKLMLNCSVTTIGAIAGQTMRQYVALPEGRALFDRAYSEALSVALASGAQPERMLVDPMPPNWSKNQAQTTSSKAYESWLTQVLSGYGDVKPSMLQDFERARPTEIDFINGYVVDLGRKLAAETPVNVAIVEAVHAIERREAVPDPKLLATILRGGRIG